MPRLTDPWFRARFVSNVAPDGRSYHYCDGLGIAQGLTFWCPCGYGRPEYQDDGRPHAVLVPFSNPRSGVVVPPCFGPQSAANPAGPRPRWVLAPESTNLDDLTLAPSIDTRGGAGGASCWHGYLTGGEVVT